MKNYNLKEAAMTENELKKVYISSVWPRDSSIYTKEEFFNIDNGRMRGTHWTCSYIKDIKAYFDSFGGSRD